MDIPHFFSDCVAEMSSDGPIASPDKFDGDGRRAAGHPRGIALDAVAGSSISIAPSSSPSLASGLPWLQPRTAPYFIEPTTSQPMMSYNTAVPGEYALSAPGEASTITASTTPAARGSTASRSATTSRSAPKSTPRTVSSTNSARPRSSKSSTSFTGPTVPPPRPPPSNKKQDRGQNPATVEQDAKRRDFLEKNKLAANKCRQRKKKKTEAMQANAESLEATNKQLKAEYNGMKDEIQQLKRAVMMHGNCNNPNIDGWIQREARNFVHGPNEGYGASQEPMAGDAQMAAPWTGTSWDGSAFEPAMTTTQRPNTAFSHGVHTPNAVGGAWEMSVTNHQAASSIQQSPFNPEFPSLTSPRQSRDSGYGGYHQLPQPLPEGFGNVLQDSFRGRYQRPPSPGAV